MKHKLIILSTNELNHITVVIIGGTVVACLYIMHYECLIRRQLNSFRFVKVIHEAYSVLKQIA